MKPFPSTPDEIRGVTIIIGIIFILGVIFVGLY